MEKLWLLLVLLICGCENYYSDFPLSEHPETQAPSESMGRWIYLDSSKVIYRPSVELEIMDWGRDEYLVLLKFMDRQDLLPSFDGGQNSEITYLYKVWLSDLGDTAFINAVKLPEKSQFQFLNYQLNRGQLHLRYLTHSLTFRAQDPKSQRRFFEEQTKQIEQHMSPEIFVFNKPDSLLWRDINHQKITAVLELKLPKKRLEIQEDGRYEIEGGQGIGDVNDENYRNFVTDRAMNVDSFMQEVNRRYHFGLGNDLMSKKKPEYFVLEVADGAIIKLKSTDFGIVDLTNGLIFVGR